MRGETIKEKPERGQITSETQHKPYQTIVSNKCIQNRATWESVNPDLLGCPSRGRAQPPQYRHFLGQCEASPRCDGIESAISSAHSRPLVKAPLIDAVVQ